MDSYPHTKMLFRVFRHKGDKAIDSYEFVGIQWP